MAKTYAQFKSMVLGKAYDIDGYYGAQCPVKGTMIAMADGSVKPVEDLKVGDLVSTGNRVITNKPRLSKIVKVKTESGTFKVSPDHKFIMTDGAEVKAKDLAPGDEVRVLTDDVKSNSKLNSDELRFLGFYLADGTKKYRHDYSQVPEIFVTIGTAEKEEYLGSLAVHLSERTHSNGKAKIFSLLNRKHPALTKIITFMDGKKLPMSFSAYEYALIIEGYLKGDGSKKRNSFVASSVCKELLVSIQHGCFLNGWRAVLSEPIIRDETNFCQNPKPVYRLTINQNKKPSGKVKWIKELDDKETIYVLNLDGNHLYFGDNHMHHNCWDGVMYYLQWLGYAAIHCGISGYVKDIYTQKETNGIKTYCTETYDLQPGDIVVFKECSSTPYSHIAIFDSDVGGGYGNFLGQNQGGAGGAFNIIKLPYGSTYYYAFRPKCLTSGSTSSTSSASGDKYPFPSGWTRQNAVFTMKYDVNTRSKPDVSAPVKYTFAKGSQIKYDGYKIIGDYVWITYCGKTERRYMVCGETHGLGYNAEPWGTFE